MVDLAVALLPDLHCPFHDPRAVDGWLERASSYLWRFRPEQRVIVALGDGADCFLLSRFSKDRRRGHAIEEEAEQLSGVLRMVEQIGAGRLVYCEGNHEARLTKYVRERAEDVAGIVKTFPELLGLRARGWEWHSYGTETMVGDLMVSHDFEHHGPNSLHQTAAKLGRGCSFAMGHTHRLGSTYGADVRGRRYLGLTCGHLSDPDHVDYRHRAYVRREHAQGGACVHLDSTGCPDDSWIFRLGR